MAYDEKGSKVWECELDIYGKIRSIGGESSFIPFRYQGQYEDVETGLFYNRFRYYSPDTGTYISQDPIGLFGRNPNFYAYTHNVNTWVDPLGLTEWVDLGMKFDDWFDNVATTDDLVNSKGKVKPHIKDALRPGGKHEMFPVSEAVKAKELGFTAGEIKKMSVTRSDVWFENVPDKHGSLHSGPHSTGAKLPAGQSSKASSWFHKNLSDELREAKTKLEAKKIIAKHHKAHMRLKPSCK